MSQETRPSRVNRMPFRVAADLYLAAGESVADRNPIFRIRHRRLALHPLHLCKE
jgi:hypothetical protein